MELAEGPTINWTQDPYGRRGQLQRQFWATEALAKEVSDSLQKKIQEISQLQSENTQQVKTAAEKAYQGVESVVKLLLTIDDGNHRLSREDPSIMAALQASITNFENLVSISHENTDQLGIKGSDCKELGDGASRLARSLGARAAALNIDAAAAWKLYKDKSTEYDSHHGKEENLRTKVREKEIDLDSTGTSIANFFNSDVGDNLRRDIRDAKERLENNLRQQNVAKENRESYYQLAVLTKNASAAMICMQQQLNHSSTEFSNEYVKVYDAQRIESTLWEGLIDLKNKIWSTDYISTRDKSLHQLLDLLTLDDAVFMRQNFFEDTEARVKAAINAKLGAGAVEKLLAGGTTLAIDDGGMNL